MYKTLYFITPVIKFNNAFLINAYGIYVYI